MPIFALEDRVAFPPPDLANEDGLLAIGGDLSPERLVTAYAMGIFPWYSEDDPILWWSPDPRMVLMPDELRITRRLARVIRSGTFEVTFDRDFETVVECCANAEGRGMGKTWITLEMKEAYIELHRLGLAHSVECWVDGRIQGGLYGVSLGSCFFGESMFSNVSNASKVALAALTAFAKAREFTFIDCQVSNAHLASLGAREMARPAFLKMLDNALESSTLRGSWEGFAPARGSGADAS